MHTPYFTTNLSIPNARIRFATGDGVVSARITASTSPLFASFCRPLEKSTPRLPLRQFIVACADRLRVVVQIITKAGFIPDGSRWTTSAPFDVTAIMAHNQDVGDVTSARSRLLAG